MSTATGKVPALSLHTFGAWTLCLRSFIGLHWRQNEYWLNSNLSNIRSDLCSLISHFFSLSSTCCRDSIQIADLELPGIDPSVVYRFQFDTFEVEIVFAISKHLLYGVSVALTDYRSSTPNIIFEGGINIDEIPYYLGIHDDLSEFEASHPTYVVDPLIYEKFENDDLSIYLAHYADISLPSMQSDELDDCDQRSIDSAVRKSDDSSSCGRMPIPFVRPPKKKRSRPRPRHGFGLFRHNLKRKLRSGGADPSEYRRMYVDYSGDLRDWFVTCHDCGKPCGMSGRDVEKRTRSAWSPPT